MNSLNFGTFGEQGVIHQKGRLSKPAYSVEGIGPWNTEGDPGLVGGHQVKILSEFRDF